MKTPCPSCGSTKYSTLFAFNGPSFCSECQPQQLVPLPMKLTISANIEHQCERCDKPEESAPSIPPPIVPGGLPESVQAADDAAALRKKLMLMEDGIRKLRLLREEYAVWKNGYSDPGMVEAFKDGMTTMLNVYDVKITELLAIE